MPTATPTLDPVVDLISFVTDVTVGGLSKAQAEADPLAQRVLIMSFADPLDDVEEGDVVIEDIEDVASRRLRVSRRATSAGINVRFGITLIVETDGTDDSAVEAAAQSLFADVTADVELADANGLFTQALEGNSAAFNVTSLSNATMDGAAMAANFTLETGVVRFSPTAAPTSVTAPAPSPSGGGGGGNGFTL